MGGCRGHDRGCMSVGAVLLILSHIETPPAVSTCPSNLHLREYTSLSLTNESLSLTNESHTLTHSHVDPGEPTYLRPPLPTPNTNPLSCISHLPYQLLVYYTIPYPQAILYIHTHLTISVYDTLYLVDGMLASSSTYRSTQCRLPDGVLCQRRTTLPHGRASFDLRLGELSERLLVAFWGGGVAVAYTYSSIHSLSISIIQGLGNNDFFWPPHECCCCSYQKVVVTPEVVDAALLSKAADLPYSVITSPLNHIIEHLA